MHAATPPGASASPPRQAATPATPRARVRRPPRPTLGTFLSLLLLAGGLYYFFGGGRIWALRLYYGWTQGGAEPVRIVAQCDRKQAQQVVDLVRGFRPGYSLHSLGDRLAIVNGWLKGHNVQMLPGQWQVVPIGLKDYYRVTYVLTGSGYQQRWRWRVNVKRGVVFPINPSAERLCLSDAQFERMFAEPKVAAKPRPAAVASASRPRPAAAQAPRTEAAPEGPPDVRLLGMVESRGTLSVLFEIAGDDVEAQQGQRLPDGWVVRQAVRNPEGGGYAVLAKGGQVVTLKLRSTTLLAVTRSSSADGRGASKAHRGEGGGDEEPASASRPRGAKQAPPPEQEEEEEADADPDAIGFPTVPPGERVDREALGLPDLRSPKPGR